MLSKRFVYIHGGAVQLTDMQFLPRCMECRLGLVMRILSVRLSVRVSHA